MSNHRHGHGHGHGSRPAREFFTLGEHPIGNRLYRFKYDGKVYHITEQLILPEQETEEKLLLEETESVPAYDAWNHIKRPERFGGMVVLPQPTKETDED